MTVRALLPALAAIAMVIGAGAAHAQTVGPDEAVGSEGIIGQKLALRAAQRSAISNAVLEQRGRASSATIPTAVGAPVSPAAALFELPDQVAAGDPWAVFLEYAMVENDIVIVDPIRMRVVDIIHASAKP